MSLEAEELNWGIKASVLRVLCAVQLRVGSPAVKRSICVCYSTAIFRVRNSVRLLLFCIKIRCQETDSGECTKDISVCSSELWSVENPGNIVQVLLVITSCVYKCNKSKHPFQTPSISHQNSWKYHEICRNLGRFTLHLSQITTLGQIRSFEFDSKVRSSVMQYKNSVVMTTTVFVCVFAWDVHLRKHWKARVTIYSIHTHVIAACNLYGCLKLNVVIKLYLLCK
jgi:hypothetical protein